MWQGAPWPAGEGDGAAANSAMWAAGRAHPPLPHQQQHPQMAQYHRGPPQHAYAGGHGGQEHPHAPHAYAGDSLPRHPPAHYAGGQQPQFADEQQQREWHLQGAGASWGHHGAPGQHYPPHGTRSYSDPHAHRHHQHHYQQQQEQQQQQQQQGYDGAAANHQNEQWLPRHQHGQHTGGSSRHNPAPQQRLSDHQPHPQHQHTHGPTYDASIAPLHDQPPPQHRHHHQSHAQPPHEPSPSPHHEAGPGSHTEPAAPQSHRHKTPNQHLDTARQDGDNVQPPPNRHDNRHANSSNSSRGGRFHGHHGNSKKPSWWIHPDPSKGFADLHAAQPYDQLPPKLPALLPPAQPPTAAAAGAAAGSAVAAAPPAAAPTAAQGLDGGGGSGEGADGGGDQALAGLLARRAGLPVLLFDLNGTLTSHTYERNSSGRNKARPGVAALARLAHKFRIGIFSSATHRTVGEARAMLEAAVAAEVQQGKDKIKEGQQQQQQQEQQQQQQQERQQGEEGQQGAVAAAANGSGGSDKRDASALAMFEPGLILHRDHCEPAGPERVQAGGKPWDTVKPLGRWFSRLDRLLLFDDDLHKSLPGERGNLVLVPGWDEGDGQCPVLVELASALEEELGGLGPEDDVRQVSGRITQRLQDAAQRRQRERASGAEGAPADAGV